MDVLELYKKMSEKRNVKVQRVLECKKKFLALYKTYMVYMYDKGYISDPTLFKEKEIYANITDMNIKGMVTVYGQVNLTPEQCRYAMYKNKHDREIVDFLRLLELTLRYRRFSQSIDKFHDCFTLPRYGIVRVGLKLCTNNGMVFSKYALNLDMALLSCLIDSEHEIIFKDIKDKIWTLAMYELGVPKEDRMKDGLIDKDLTHEEEVECIELLLEGKLTSDGLYKEQYEKWMFDHLWSKQELYCKQRGLYTHTLIEYGDDIKATKNHVIEWMEDHDIEPIFLLGHYVIGSKPRVTTVMPIGQFSILQTEENEYWGSDRNLLEGYTGEAYQVEYLDSEEIAYVGCPIELYITDKETGYFIDLEQTEINSYKTWFEVVNATLEFDEGSIAPANARDTVNGVFNIVHNAKIGEIMGVMTLYVSQDMLESAKIAVYPYIKESDDED